VLKWFRRYVAWLGFAMALAGSVAIYFGWSRAAHIDEITERGRDAVAVIEHAKSVSRKDLVSFAVSLAWKAQDGQVMRADGVPVSAGFAGSIIVDGRLVVPAAKIRYLPGHPDRWPVVLEDAQALRAEARRWLWSGTAALLLGLMIGFGLMLSWPRRVAEGA
jgi:hypothetical protein